MSKNIILGAGISGLYAAFKLSNKDDDIIILEKNDQIGGLCKTRDFGNFRSDLGGHRLYIQNKDVKNFIKNILGKDLLIVKRKSKIYFDGKFIDYPPNLENIFKKFKKITALKIILSYLGQNACNIFQKKEDNLEDWLIRRYGRTLYNIYFKPYSEKIWGMNCKKISSDWAGNRIGSSSLKNLIMQLFFNKVKRAKENADYFIYPKKGISKICIGLKEKIEKKGCSIITNSDVIQVDLDKSNKVKQAVTNENGKKCVYLCDNLISTMPVNELIDKIIPKPPKFIIESSKMIKHRSEIFIFLEIFKENVTKDHWIYFPQKELIFSRVHEPKNWSKDMVQNENTALCIEIHCNFNDKLWNMDDKYLLEMVINQLVSLNLIKRTDVGKGIIERVEYAYPLFYLDYKKHLEIVNSFLKEIKNLKSIGRQGAHQYLDIEECLSI